MIYDVTDTGQQYGYGVRGSATNVELGFHTDNAFGMRVPDFVGLLCKYPAVSGGLSRFCSLYTVHERMETNHPEALQRLYQPMLFDRQAEHCQAIQRFAGRLFSPGVQSSCDVGPTRRLFAKAIRLPESKWIRR